MKKIITMFMLMAAAITMYAATANPVYVYNYQASFKTLSVGKVKIKDRGYTLNLDSAKPCTMKIEGYIVMEACSSCNGTMDYSTDDDNKVVVYVKRSGTKDFVYRAVGAINANMFGRKTGVNSMIGGLINGNMFTDCTGFIAFPLDWAMIDGAGFLGNRNFTLDSYSGAADFNDFRAEPELICWNGGYGKVGRKVTVVDAGCMTAESSCYYITNMSGNMLSQTGWSGRCTDFLFDICDPENTNAFNAPLNGTFSMKINNSLTYKNGGFRNGSFAEAETMIKDLMKATRFFVPANDFESSSLGLETGEYWDDTPAPL